MTRIFLAVLLAFGIASCATTSQRNQDLVSRALDAVGGADAIGKIRTTSARISWRQWEPEQSSAAGGESRFANEATIEVVTDAATRSTRFDWVKNFEYPSKR